MKIGQPKLIPAKRKGIYRFDLPGEPSRVFKKKRKNNMADTAPNVLDAWDRLSKIFDASLFFARFHLLTESFSQAVIGDGFPFLGQHFDAFESYTSFGEHL